MEVAAEVSIEVVAEESVDVPVQSRRGCGDPGRR